MTIVYVERSELESLTNSEIPKGEGKLVPVEITDKSLEYAEVYEGDFELDHTKMIESFILKHYGEKPIFKIKYKAKQYVTFATISDEIFIGFGETVPESIEDLYDRLISVLND